MAAELQQWQQSCSNGNGSNGNGSNGNGSNGNNGSSSSGTCNGSLNRGGGDSSVHNYQHWAIRVGLPWRPGSIRHPASTHISSG